MKTKVCLKLFLPTLLILPTYILSGCATIQSSGIFQKKNLQNENLNGKADLYGTIRMADNLTAISGFQVYNNSEKTYGLNTHIKIEPGDIKTISDKDGKFTVKGLEPGNYSIYFFDPDSTTKRADIRLLPDNKFNLTIYVQIKNSYSQRIHGTSEHPYYNDRRNVFQY